MSDQRAVEAAAVRGELERVLASKGFGGTNRSSTLLRYLVEQTLAGRGDELKEYTLGVEVFGRGGDYDPRVDAIVRVEAGRLRSRLDDYYEGDGSQDPVIISIDKGGYVPRFEPRLPDPTLGETRGAAIARWTGLAGLIVVLVAAAWVVAGRNMLSTPQPTVAVLPFDDYSETAEGARLAAQATDGVTAELARLGTIGVVSRTTTRQYDRRDKPLRQIATELGANYIMEASVERTASGQVRIQARLVDASTDRKMWVQDAASADMHAAERDIAAAAATAVLERWRQR